MPFWCSTCYAADNVKASNEDLWDAATTSSRSAPPRPIVPVSMALSDEQLTWEHFIDANDFLWEWPIPEGWPEAYAKVLTSFFRQIENHDGKGIAEGTKPALAKPGMTSSMPSIF
jgi:hypothetical protein